MNRFILNEKGEVKAIVLTLKPNQDIMIFRYGGFSI